MKVIVVGALGRMGVKLISALEQAKDSCVALVDSGYAESAGNVYTDISLVKKEADVIIDFSFHTATPDVAEYAARTKTPLVIATTGHTPEEKERIERASRSVAIFFSGNMSLGIATLCDTVKRVVSVFDGADVEIIETHHNRKIDSPSGTALMLLDSVKEARPSAYANLGRSGHGKREKDEVGICSVRCGNIVGIHEVRITTDTEQITLKHEAYDRALFADGAIKAAGFIIGKENGIYGMKELLAQ